MRRFLFFIVSAALAFCAGCDPQLAMNPMKLDKTKLEFLAAEESREVVSLNQTVTTIGYLYLTDSKYNKIQECEVITIEEGQFTEVKGEWISAILHNDKHTVSVTVDENDTGKTRYALLCLKNLALCGDAGMVKIVQKAK